MSNEDINDLENRDSNWRMQLFKSNIQVLFLTSPANLFHALRRQLVMDFRKPLFIAAPKKLLRHKLVKSNLADFSPEKK